MDGVVDRKPSVWPARNARRIAQRNIDYRQTEQLQAKLNWWESQWCNGTIVWATDHADPDLGSELNPDAQMFYPAGGFEPAFPHTNSDIDKGLDPQCGKHSDERPRGLPLITLKPTCSFDRPSDSDDHDEHIPRCFPLHQEPSETLSSTLETTMTYCNSDIDTNSEHESSEVADLEDAESVEGEEEIDWPSRTLQQDEDVALLLAAAEEQAMAELKILQNYDPVSNDMLQGPPSTPDTSSIGPAPITPTKLKERGHRKGKSLAKQVMEKGSALDPIPERDDLVSNEESEATMSDDFEGCKEDIQNSTVARESGDTGVPPVTLEDIGTMIRGLDTMSEVALLGEEAREFAKEVHTSLGVVRDMQEVTLETHKGVEIKVDSLQMDLATLEMRLERVETDRSKSSASSSPFDAPDMDNTPEPEPFPQLSARQMEVLEESFHSLTPALYNLLLEEKRLRISYADARSSGPRDIVLALQKDIQTNILRVKDAIGARMTDLFLTASTLAGYSIWIAFDMDLSDIRNHFTPNIDEIMCNLIIAYGGPYSLDAFERALIQWLDEDFGCDVFLELSK